MFVAARFFVGFGNSLASNAAPLLLTELCHPQHRGRVTTLYNQLWDIGSILATWITYGTFTMKNNWGVEAPIHLPGTADPAPLPLHLDHSRVSALAVVQGA